MSGGVDSSVAAALLVEQGGDVVGVTLRVWPWSEPAEPTKRFGSCCGTDSSDDARHVARALGIPYYLLNIEREFDHAVVGPFAAARFPVGDLTKDEVRAHARRLGLVTADKPESQEICFVPDDDYRGFLRRREPGVFRPGPIVDRQGRVLGMHGGVAGYTIGQKKGLGLAVGRSLYVVDLDPERATVVVGGSADLERDRLVARAVNFISCSPPSAAMRVEA